MSKTGLIKPITVPKTFTDVLFLTNKDELPLEIAQLFKQKKLSYITISLDQFSHLMHRLDLIGTVVIDTEQLQVSQQQKLARIIESLEVRNIGTIVLNARVELPVKSFSLAGPQVKSFSLATKMESISSDELWKRINVNLTFRKKNSGIILKTPMLPSQMLRSSNNRLAEQLRITKSMVENLTEQLRMAGLVQRDFLPTQLPNMDHLHWAATFMPAEWVSGDIYDVVRIDEDHIGFYIADSVGHSMPAALLTIFVKQAMVLRETRDKDYHIFSPAEVMRNLNKKMAEQKLSGYQFATCCYCLLNIKTLELTFARGGHPYPVLIRPGQPPEQLEIRGSLLGIFEEADFIQQTVQLRSGDKILIYSDGAEPFIGEFDDLSGFGFNEKFDQIKDLHVVDMIEQLNEIVHDKKHSATEVDDITAVALEIL